MYRSKSRTAPFFARLVYAGGPAPVWFKYPLYYGLIPALSVMGITTNILTCVVFRLLGLKDGMSIMFFMVGLVDTCFICTGLSGIGYEAYMRFGQDTSGNGTSPLSYSVLVMLFPAQNIVFDISMLITVAISIQRCVCVTLPIQFRNMFTRRRTILMIFAILFMFLAGIATPLFAIQAHTRAQMVSELSNASGNLSKITPEDALLSHVAFVLTILGSTVVTLVSYFIVLINAVLIITALYRSSLFRKRHSSIAVHPTQADSGRSLSIAEIKVAKCVTVFLAIFIACNLPGVVYMIYGKFEVTIDTGLVWDILVDLSCFGQVLSASTTMFVHYNFNSKFHTACTLLMAHMKTCCRGDNS